jgi:hypothetical protein
VSAAALSDMARKVMSVDGVLRRIDLGALDRATIATVVAEQLSDDEFDALTGAQAKAVSLRRLGLTSVQCADALEINQTAVNHYLAAAAKRGVVVERERAA